MLKIFGPKVVNRVRIPELNTGKYTEQLYQAKGVIENYLKDKNFKVTITDLNDKFMIVEAFSDKKNSISSTLIKKEDGDIPFLRKIYKKIEDFAKDPNINVKNKA